MRRSSPTRSAPADRKSATVVSGPRPADAARRRRHRSRGWPNRAAARGSIPAPASPSGHGATPRTPDSHATTPTRPVRASFITAPRTPAHREHDGDTDQYKNQHEDLIGFQMTPRQKD